MTMIQKLLIPAALVALLGSCGPSKELQLANAQNQQLQANNKALAKNVDDLKKEVSDSKSGESALKAQLSTCQANAQATEQQLQAVKSAMREEAENLQKVQQKIDDAMSDFHSKGVEVSFRNGLVYVSLSDHLLYKSGSAVLSDSGKKALVSLADVLNGYPKLRVIVLGNTDSMKVMKKGADNWSLSTERANGVVRVLRDANVDPTRLTSAGKGRYNPVADNATAEGRAKNRRIDIILNPDMDRIWQSVRDEK